MSVAELPVRKGEPFQDVETTPESWRVFRDEHVYECKVLLCPEEVGGYSAHALKLPGVVSQGETEVEALANIKEALQGAIVTYIEAGELIPWGDVRIDDAPGDSRERWILVDV